MVTEIWKLACTLAYATGANHLDEKAGCWEYVVPPWYFAFNPHDHQVDSSRRRFIGSGCLYVEYDGRPAAMVGASTGDFLASDVANESTLIAALKDEIARIKAAPAGQISLVPAKPVESNPEDPKPAEPANE